MYVVQASTSGVCQKRAIVGSPPNRTGISRRESLNMGLINVPVVEEAESINRLWSLTLHNVSSSESTRKASFSPVPFVVPRSDEDILRAFSQRQQEASYRLLSCDKRWVCQRKACRR